MLESAVTILNQLFIMLIMIVAGYLVYKFKIVDDNGAKQISSLLVNVAMPFIIFASYQRVFEKELAKSFVLVFLLAAVLLGISVIIANFIYKKDTENYKDKRMSVIFPNNGFMALPLLQAMFGDFGVFLGACNIAAGNIYMWTYGVNLLSKEKIDRKTSIKKGFINPATIAVFFGIILFCSPYKLPENVYTAVSYLGSLNTPLAMIALGIYLAQSDIKRVFRDKRMYSISFVKLILIPAVCLVLLKILHIDSTLCKILMVGTATPTAVAAPIFAQLYGTNYRYSSEVVSITTVLCAVTLPVFIALC